jgi:quercetin dioxygenase-like cupin family protein
MKKSVYVTLGVLAVSLGLAFGAVMVMAQDIAKLSPQDVKVLLENDRVRVLEVRHQPGVKEPMHSHPAYVTYFLGATTMKVTSPDGKTVVKDRKAGEIQFNEPVTHALENVGTTEQHVLVIELKK